MILEELGRGGMGVVFLAAEARGRRRVALKTLLPHAPALAKERFQREAEAQARVDQHPHVGRIVSAGVHAGRLFHVQDYASGGDLAARLRRGPLSAAEAQRVVAAVASGIAHLHAHGVVHRDLKPGNVLFDGEGRPLIVDFGVARLLDADSLTRSGQILGTIAYMAPEQLDDSRSAGAPADVYALGALLYASLSGRAPFAADASYSLMTAVFRDPPAPLGRPDLDPAWEALILSALAKDPAQRPLGAEAFREALLALPLAEEAAGRAPRRVGLGLALGALLCGLLGALAWAAWTAWGAGPRGAPSPSPGPAASASPATPQIAASPSLAPRRWFLGAGEAEYRLRWEERALSGFSLRFEGLLRLRSLPSGQLELRWEAREATTSDESAARQNGAGVFSDSRVPDDLLAALSLGEEPPLCVLDLSSAGAREVEAARARADAALKAALEGRLDTPLAGMEMLFDEFKRLARSIYTPRALARVVEAGFSEGAGAFFEEGGRRPQSLVGPLPFSFFFGDLSVKAYRAELLGLPRESLVLSIRKRETRISGARIDDPVLKWPKKIDLELHTTSVEHLGLEAWAKAELTRLTVRGG